MSSKSNMERAKREESWFWFAAVATVCVLLAYFNSGVVPAEGGRGKFLVAICFILTGVMIGCVYRLTRLFKKEIADLKSGDSDTASVTASTDPPAEGSPTPEGD